MFLKPFIFALLLFTFTPELTVEEILDNIEKVNVTSVTSDVTYVKTDPILLRKETRTGRLLYRSCLQDHKEVAIAFDSLIIGRRKETKKKQYIFSGRWFVERDPELKQFIKRELVSPEEAKAIDHFALGNGPIPLPIAQSKESVLKQFDVSMTTLPSEGILSKLGDQTIGLFLTPKEDGEWESISLYYDPETWLPVGVHTIEEDGTTRTSRLTNIVLNALNSEEAELLDIKTPDPTEWSIDIQPYSN